LSDRLRTEVRKFDPLEEILSEDSHVISHIKCNAELEDFTCGNVYIENNTWVRGNTRFISSVDHVQHEFTCSQNTCSHEHRTHVQRTHVHTFICLNK
jgi:hypothetical protein